MRRQQTISSLVYNYLYPTPGPDDPPNFAAHLSRNLIGEVRIETARFYGSLDTVEARYPGLNYSHIPHRKRLSYFPHHARLFEAFDALDLTESEIASLVRWEGSLWARQRYERDEGIIVRDTTGDEILPWVRTPERDPQNITIKTNIEVEIEEVDPMSEHGVLADEMVMDESGNVEMEDDSEDEVETSIGIDLNQRLMAAAEVAGEQGIPAGAVDPEWEAYLKEAAERGGFLGDYPTGFLAAYTARHVASQASASRTILPPTPPSAS